MSSWPSSESGHPSSSASRMEWRWTSQQTPCWPLERARRWWGTQHVSIARAAARSLLTACTEENAASFPEIHDQVTQGSMWMCVCLCPCDTLPFGLTSRQCRGDAPPGARVSQLAGKAWIVFRQGWMMMMHRALLQIPHSIALMPRSALGKRRAGNL